MTRAWRILIVGLALAVIVNAAFLALYQHWYSLVGVGMPILALWAIYRAEA